MSWAFNIPDPPAEQLTACAGPAGLPADWHQPLASNEELRPANMMVPNAQRRALLLHLEESIQPEAIAARAPPIPNPLLARPLPPKHRVFLSRGPTPRMVLKRAARRLLPKRVMRSAGAYENPLRRGYTEADMEELMRLYYPAHHEPQEGLWEPVPYVPIPTPEEEAYNTEMRARIFGPPPRPLVMPNWYTRLPRGVQAEIRAPPPRPYHSSSSSIGSEEQEEDEEEEEERMPRRQIVRRPPSPIRYAHSTIVPGVELDDEIEITPEQQRILSIFQQRLRQPAEVEGNGPTTSEEEESSEDGSESD